MLVSIFSIHDNLVGYPRLFTDHSEAVAERGFRNAIVAQLEGKSNDSTVSPVDLSLYCFGTFDTVEGSVDLYPIPRLICSGVSVVNSFMLDRADRKE